MSNNNDHKYTRADGLLFQEGNDVTKTSRVGPFDAVMMTEQQLQTANDNNNDNTKNVLPLQQAEQMPKPTFDCVELGVCLVFWIVTVVGPTVLSIRPRQRDIPFQLLENSGEYVRNLVYNETFDGDTVTDLWLVIIAGIVPIVTSLFLSGAFRRARDTQGILCVFMVATGLTIASTEFVKVYVGYLRPIFYTECDPNDDYSECTLSDDNNIRKSFPSGHASLSFCGLTLLSLYLERLFGLTSIRRLRMDHNSGAIVLCYAKQNPRLYRLGSLLSLAPMIAALFIAASRVVDNKHFPADVVAGSLLGAAIAAYTHSLWFPSLPTADPPQVT